MSHPTIRVLDKRSRMKLSRAFVKDLRMVCSSEAMNTHDGIVKSLSGFPRLFFKDLHEVYITDKSVTRERTTNELATLATILDTLRMHCRNAVRKKSTALRHNFPSDPIFCSIGLLGIMGYGHLEVAHTRMLAWLLDPNGNHGFGQTLSEALLKYIWFKRNRGFYDVWIEYVDSEKRFSAVVGVAKRADVWMEGVWRKGPQRGKKFLVVIEAKINASEGEEQLRHYDRILQYYKHDHRIFRVFLTTDGRLAQTSHEDWINISFRDVCSVFRDAMRNLRRRHGYPILRFYIAGVMKDILHWPLPLDEAYNKLYSVMTYISDISTTGEDK